MHYRSLFLSLSIGMTFLTSCNGALSFHLEGDESPSAVEDRPASAPASLVKAAGSGDVAAVEQLLKAGAAPNTLEGGRTPLMEAAYHDQAAVARELLQHEAIDPNQQERGVGGHRTALMSAAAFDSLEVVQALVSCARVEVNFKSDNGVTALMWAAASRGDKSQAIIEALLERPEIDLKVEDNKGRTAYAIARANKANRTILEKLHFEGCLPIAEAIEEAEEVHQTGQPFRQEGNVTMYQHEHEGDIDITDLQVSNTIHRGSNDPLPNQTGNLLFYQSKTKGKLTIGGGTLTNTVHYGSSKDPEKKSDEVE